MGRGRTEPRKVTVGELDTGDGNTKQGAILVHKWERRHLKGVPRIGLGCLFSCSELIGVENLSIPREPLALSKFSN